MRLQIQCLNWFEALGSLASFQHDQVFFTSTLIVFIPVLTGVQDFVKSRLPSIKETKRIQIQMLRKCAKLHGQQRCEVKIRKATMLGAQGE